MTLAKSSYGLSAMQVSTLHLIKPVNCHKSFYIIDILQHTISISLNKCVSFYIKRVFMEELLDQEPPLEEVIGF